MLGKRNLLLSAVFVAGTMLLSCSQSWDLGDQKTGEGVLNVAMRGDADFGTRAVTESAYENTDNYTVVVTDKDGVEKIHCKGSELPFKMPLPLNMGSYKVQAYYGVEHDASRDEFYVFGEAEGNIRAGMTENVSLVCTPTCGRITVNFDALMETFFSDYHVSFTDTEALGTKSIVWAKDDTQPWYVKLEEGGETISFTITTVAHEEFVNSNQQQVASQKGSFRLDRNKGYKMNISPNYIPEGTGALEVGIIIDDSTNDIPVDIETPIDWI